eukprot:362365-Chlamydomonas_euryale.AAC.1
MQCSEHSAGALCCFMDAALLTQAARWGPVRRGCVARRPPAAAAAARTAAVPAAPTAGATAAGRPPTCAGQASPGDGARPGLGQ